MSVRKLSFLASLVYEGCHKSALIGIGRPAKELCRPGTETR